MSTFLGGELKVWALSVGTYLSRYKLDEVGGISNTCCCSLLITFPLLFLLVTCSLFRARRFMSRPRALW